MIIESCQTLQPKNCIKIYKRKNTRNVQKWIKYTWASVNDKVVKRTGR